MTVFLCRRAFIRLRPKFHVSLLMSLLCFGGKDFRRNRGGCQCLEMMPFLRVSPCLQCAFPSPLQWGLGVLLTIHFMRICPQRSAGSGSSLGVQSRSEGTGEARRPGTQCWGVLRPCPSSLRSQRTCAVKAEGHHGRGAAGEGHPLPCFYKLTLAEASLVLRDPERRNHETSFWN